jgi:hypothetical protein
MNAALGEMLDDLAGTMRADVAAARAALRAVIAEDVAGHCRLDAIADPAAPDGFRVEGMLRIPLSLGKQTPSTKGGDPGVSRPRLTDSASAWARLPIPLMLPVSWQATE